MMDLAVLLPAVKQAALDSCRCFKRIPDLQVENKGPNDFITRIDREISDYLCAELPKLLDDSQVISEEQQELPGSAPYRWIIDPIDGTNNLIYDLPFYAVSIGLVLEKEPLLGVIYMPASGELFSAARKNGAFVENPLTGSAAKSIRVNDADSLSRAIVMAETDPYFEREKNPSLDLIKSVYRYCIDLRITGSAAIDLSYIAAGRAMAHFCRHLNPWDYAGGSSILTEAGGIVSQWDGSPMPYEGKHTSLAASSKPIHEAMLELVRPYI
ncbi:MAG: inositol monophosphatase [Treponema sp.]|jgi:myo-inositol-1(or 4)-monophosphatase|nr:inositol monophosphatase [Treponema sp.]